MAPTDRNIVNFKIESCMNCPNHIVERDPDPTDWFCDDDEAVLCGLSPNIEHTKHYAQALGEFKFRPITWSCRPYNKEKETKIPDWCPLLKETSNA